MVAPRILNSIWYTHPGATLLVQAKAAVCLRTLADAAKPSTQRLHLRNLFTEGRRYFLRPAADGFQMTVSSKIWWQRSRRTRVAALLSGTLIETGSDITRVQLRAHINPIYLIDIFVLPLWMSILLIFSPLSRPVAIGAAVLLLVLSWLWHRANALLQSTEMIYFVQVALDDLVPAVIPTLGESTENVVVSDFQTQWQKFYERHKDEE